MDPFDDVRHASTACLKLMVGSEGGPNMNSNISDSDEQKTMLNGRADHADGVARLNEILFGICPDRCASVTSILSSKQALVEHLVTELEKTVDAASQDLGTAVSSFPLHGLFSSLKYMFDRPGFYTDEHLCGSSYAEWQNIHRRVFAALENVWSAVRNVLCNDAPEGYLPEDMEEEAGVTTKDVLSYSWRAMKEASLLLRVIISKAPLTLPSSSRTGLLNVSDISNMGYSCFNQLAELRHRGAFSTVAQTFVACCNRCSEPSKQDLHYLLEEWYNNTFLCIRNNSTINTRRSAGIPSLLTAILIADPGNLFFERAIEDLCQEASRPAGRNIRQEGGLSQAHALNCLKDIFKNTQLGVKSEKYIPRALALAADGLASDLWAIRNCGLMLFRGLIDRLLGTNNSYAGDDGLTKTLISYDRYSNLLDLITRLLTPAFDSSNGEDHSGFHTEGVFPALQLLHTSQIPPDKLPKIRSAVLRLTASSQWLVRAKAAHAYVSLVEHSSFRDHVRQLLAASLVDQNALHGSLLCVRRMVVILAQSLPQSSGALNELIGVIATAIHLLVDNPCPFTQAAYVDILGLCLRTVYTNFPSKMTNAASLLRIDFQSHGKIANAHTHSMLRKSIAVACFYQNISRPDTGEPSFEQRSTKVLSDSQLLDPDIIVAVLEEANSVLSLEAKVSPTTARAITTLCLLGLHAAADIECSNAAQETLSRLLEQGGDTSFLGLNLNHRDNLGHRGTWTPSYYNRWLCLQGLLLDSMVWKTATWTQTMTEDFTAWAEMLKEALNERSPLDTRTSAAQALAHLQRFWQLQKNLHCPPELILILCLLTYNVLNDDDDDVREIGADIVSRILGAEPGQTIAHRLIPIVASQRLLAYLTEHCGCPRLLCREAVVRLTNHAVTAHPEDCIRVQELLHNASQDDAALFAEERQNLYVDPVREARVWSQVLMRLPLNGFVVPLISQLGTWTEQGLAVLTNMTRIEQDGPLGWSSKPEVFTLGMSIIFAAEILLNLPRRKKSSRLPLRRSRICKALVDLLEKYALFSSCYHQNTLRSRVSRNIKMKPASVVVVVLILITFAALTFWACWTGALTSEINRYNKEVRKEREREEAAAAAAGA
ncbi:hypothetical protein LTR28_011832 [Elasticomyces elasticus]|nr:hypothetical protein LTR28_011832 [Elasticomyces elasticus]